MKILMTLWVWTLLGLAWEPLRGLRLGVRPLVHPVLAWTVAKVTFYFLFFVCALFFVFGLAYFVWYCKCLRQHNKWGRRMYLKLFIMI